MNPDFDNPSSVASIKRLARAIRSVEGRKYSDALEAAAHRAGHASFQAAVRSADTRKSRATHRATIIEYWRDWTAKEAGNVKLTVELSQPLSSLVKQHQLEGRLSNFRIVGTDTLDGRTTLGCGESTAKWFAARAARCLQFMDATGLKPCRKHRNIWPNDDSSKRIPDADHFATWYHPQLKAYVITDEPYHGYPRPEHAERRQWCEKYGYDLEPVKWRGMHNPSPGSVGGTVLYLIAKATDGVPLHRLAELANQLPDPISDEAAISVNKRSTRLFQ